MSERLTPEQRAEIQTRLYADTVQEVLQALDDLEALEKVNDGSIERSYREASKVAIDILWSEHPEIPYESPKQVLEWLKAECDALRAQNDQYVETNADLIGQLGNMQADNESLRTQPQRSLEYELACRDWTDVYHNLEIECGSLRAQLKANRYNLHWHVAVQNLRSENAALRANCKQQEEVITLLEATIDTMLKEAAAK